MQNYTTINHQARRRLELSWHEYGLADLIYHLSCDPKAPVIGWCYAKRQYLADQIGVTRRSILTIVGKLKDAGLVAESKETGNLQTTEKWYSEVVMSQWEKTSHDGKKLPIGWEETSHRDGKKLPIPYKEDITIHNNKNNNTPQTPQGGDLFERFWIVYPRKIGKGAARRMFDRIKPKPNEAFVGRMIEAVQSQMKSDQWQKDGGVYIPHPATWIHQERWDDEIKNHSSTAGISVDGETWEVPEQNYYANR